MLPFCIKLLPYFFRVCLKSDTPKSRRCGSSVEMWIVTKDLSWKDAGLSFETYLTDALEKVPWIGDWLCVGCSVPLEQVTCWGTFDDLAPLCSGINRDGVISNKRRCHPPLGQNIGEMAVQPVGNASNMHMLHMSLFFIFGLERWRWLSELRCLHWCEPEQKQPSSWWDVLNCEFLVP